MKKKIQWAWNYPDSYTSPYGPFPSREKAEADAARCSMARRVDGPIEIEIGHPRWANPLDHMPSAERIHEWMNEDALDNDFSFADADIFDATKKQTDALDRLLTKWAQGLKRGNVWVFEKIETITLGKL